MADSFWLTLQKIVKQTDGQAIAIDGQQQQQQPSRGINIKEGESSGNIIKMDELNELISKLNIGDLEKRVSDFETVVKLFDKNLLLSEELANLILLSTLELFDINKTPIQHRHQSFSLLQQLAEKRIVAFDTTINKNLLFNIICNNYNINRDDRQFDDISFRFSLFKLISKCGQNILNKSDYSLIFECLHLFVDNSLKRPVDKNLVELFDLFINLITEHHIVYIEIGLQVKLCKCLFDYSVLRKKSSNAEEVKSLVHLVDHLTSKLTTKESVKYFVLCLCDLSGLDNLTNEMKTIVTNSFQSLFNGRLGYCAFQSLIQELFDKNKLVSKYNKRMVFGALAHIKQVSETHIKHVQESKQPKSKSSRDILIILYELFVGTLYNLSNVIIALGNDLTLIDCIIKLLISFMNITYSRDHFNSLMPFNTKEFFLDVTHGCFSKVKKGDESAYNNLISLLNLIEKKYFKPMIQSNSTVNATAQPHVTPTTHGHSLHPSIVHQQLAAAHANNYNEDLIFNNSLKKKFYKIIDEFPCIDDLNDTTVNNYLSFFLHEQYLPYKNNNWLNATKVLVTNVFNKSTHISVRKFCLEAILKQMELCDKFDWRTLREEVVDHVLVPTFTNIHREQSYELKIYVITNLFEISKKCENQKQLASLLEIFEKVISEEIAGNNNESNLLLTKTVQILIELFDYCSYRLFTIDCVQIYEILVKFLEAHYERRSQLPLSPTNIVNLVTTSPQSSPAATTTSPTSVVQQLNRITPSAKKPEVVEQYEARKNIFDFLMRIRSDEHKQFYLLTKQDRKKSKVHRYLILTTETPTSSSIFIDYKKVVYLLISCLERENEAKVLDKVLNDLPSILQSQMDLLSAPILHLSNDPSKLGFSQRIFNLVLHLTKHKQESLYKNCRIITSLILYHQYLDVQSKENLLHYFCNGTHSKANSVCLDALTVVIYELHEQLKPSIFANILIKLSQISFSNLSSSLLELLSNITEVPKLFESGVFTNKEYIAVAAIAIRYTDPLKFNSYIVLLAHYVICIWFLKCKGEVRKAFADFALKGLQEVIAQMDYKQPVVATPASNNNRMSPKDSKSPIKEENKLVQTKDDKTKTVLVEAEKQFFRELVEITADFMANYMHSNPTMDLLDIGKSNSPNQNTDLLRRNTHKYWIVNNCVVKISSVTLKNTDGLPIPHLRINPSSSSSNPSSNTTTTSSCGEKTDQEFFEENIDDTSDGSGGRPRSSSASSINSKRRYKSGVEENKEKSKKDPKQSKHSRRSKDDLSLSTSNEGPTCSKRLLEENCKELCKPSCWCNSLVEVNLNYPTKEISYVAIIENKMHDLDLPLKFIDRDKLPSLKSIDTKRPSQAAASENRRNNLLARISESSVLQDSNGKQEAESVHVDTTESNDKSSNSMDPLGKSFSSKFSRQSSFDSSIDKSSSQRSDYNIAKTSSLNDSKSSNSDDVTMSSSINTLNLSVDPTAAQISLIEEQFRNRITYTNQQYVLDSSVNNELSPIASTTEESIQRLVSKSGNRTIFGSSATNADATKIDPNEVFLNLCQQSSTSADSVIPVPTECENTANHLDFWIPFMHIFKIGVIYIRPNQTTDETAILSNACGSARYNRFLQGLGSYVKIRDLDVNKIYSGGLSKDGTSGDFSIYWTDGITQIMFNVATLMPLTSNNTTSKKKHIGNDDTLIVYNESDEEYQISYIKGEVNGLCIEIEPLKGGANNIKLKGGNDMVSQMEKFFGPKESQVISDEYLPLLVRKTAFHANIAMKLHRQQKFYGEQYGGHWWRRLKEINNYKSTCKAKMSKKSANS